MMLRFTGCAITEFWSYKKCETKTWGVNCCLRFGGIGLNIIQAANLVSAYPIIAVDLYDERLQLAKKFGATHLINSSKSDFAKEICSIVNGNLDVFVDNTGLPEIIEQGYELINKDGRLILVGVPKKGKNINIFSLPLHFGKTITGSFGGECNPEKDIPRYLNLMTKGKWSIEGLVTERYALKDINIAISRIRDGSTVGRVLIDF